MLKRSKRVRPEDIDLPQFAQKLMAPLLDPAGSIPATTVDAATKEEESRLQKRKNYLSAQFSFTKKLAAAPSSTQKPVEKKMVEENEQKVDTNDKYMPLATSTDEVNTIAKR